MTYKRAAAMIAALALMHDGALAQGAMAAAPAAEPTTPAAATPAAAPLPAETPGASCCAVPVRSPIEIEMLDTINSKDNHNGESFRFRVAEPLSVGGRVVIPAGTTGVGEVVHAARARAMGKAGELILAARYLDLNGTRIPLRTLRFGTQQGRDNSGTVTAIGVASAGTIPVASLVAFVITGGEVRVPAGTRGTVQTAAEFTLAPVE
jgi:hypothetical protein